MDKTKDIVKQKSKSKNLFITYISDKEKTIRILKADFMVDCLKYTFLQPPF